MSGQTAFLEEFLSLEDMETPCRLRLPAFSFVMWELFSNFVAQRGYALYLSQVA